MNVVKGLTLTKDALTGYSPILDLGEGSAAMIVGRTLRIAGASTRVSFYGELSLNGVNFAPIGASPLFFLATAPTTSSVVLGAYFGGSGNNNVPLAARYFRLKFVLTGSGTYSATFDADVSFKAF